MRDRHADRRQQILGAVAACVSEEGIAAVTMRNIARRMGATTGMLTHYYETRSALLKATSEAADDDLRRRVRHLVGASEGLDRLCALFEESLAPSTPDALGWAFWLEYLAAAGRDAELGAHSKQRLDDLRTDVECCVQQAIASGAFRDDTDIAIAVQTIVAFMQGLGVELAIHGAPLDRTSRAAFRALLDGYRAT